MKLAKRKRMFAIITAIVLALIMVTALAVMDNNSESPSTTNSGSTNTEPALNEQ